MLTPRSVYCGRGFPVRQCAQSSYRRDLNGMRPWFVSADQFHLIWYNVCFPETPVAVGKLPVVHRTNGPDIESVVPNGSSGQEHTHVGSVSGGAARDLDCLGWCCGHNVDAKWFHLCWPISTPKLMSLLKAPPWRRSPASKERKPGVTTQRYLCAAHGGHATQHGGRMFRNEPWALVKRQNDEKRVEQKIICSVNALFSFKSLNA